MAITIPMHKNKATRGPGLHLVPNQRTERHQAEDPPSVWPPHSWIDRLSVWFETLTNRQIIFILALVAVCVVVGAVVANL
jgi:hypothetical protein